MARPALAQAPVERPATHVVKKGDTLWDLAKLYLGDPFQWPQIYKLNTDKIKDPHWIYPGQRFSLPGGTAPVAAGPDSAAPVTAARGSMTVFNPASRAVVKRTREAVVLSARRTAVRPGDYEAAPFMWAVGGPTNGGKLEGSAETLGLVAGSARRPMQFREQAFITMPRGVEAAPGQKLLVYRLDHVVPGQGQVVVPVGIVQVLAALEGGRARASLVTKFEDVFAGQGVIVLETLAMPPATFPTRVEFGMTTRVAWLYADPKLPANGHQIILAASGAQGLTTGDQVTLLRPRGGDAAAVAAGAATGGLPDEEVAVAQVTRVTAWGASAMVLEARDAGIVAGMRAQVTAKMP